MTHSANGLLARIAKRFAPIQVQPAPVGGVFLTFLELRQRQMRLVLFHQGLDCPGPFIFYVVPKDGSLVYWKNYSGAHTRYA